MPVLAKAKRNKLDDNAVKIFFVGYSKESPEYELYDLEQGTFITTCSIDLLESTRKLLST